MQNLNVERIRKAAAESEAAQGLLSYLSKRARGRQELNIDSVSKAVAREAGVDVTPHDVLQVFKALEDAGAGRIIYGRGGNKNRFFWSYNLVSVAKAMKGEEDSPKEFKPKAKPLPEVDASASVVDEPLHPDVMVETPVVQDPKEEKTKPGVVIVRRGRIEIRTPEDNLGELGELLKKLSK